MRHMACEANRTVATAVDDRQQRCRVAVYWGADTPHGPAVPFESSGHELATGHTRTNGDVAQNLPSRIVPRSRGCLSRMVAAGRTPSHAKSEIVSPELVLVDPRLAAEARELQSGQQDAAARLEQLDSDELPVRSERVEPCLAGDEEVAEALRRITELSEVVPAQRRSLRLFVASRLRRRRAPSPS